ncbi:type IVB secretion system protein IcmM/DotJ [Legionella maioricensis]|uniref:Type IVB secretion system protein IcmM/DotJ n=1 Tax=Legionella maioricensis TaxID=2896528 RepID=A0A9X2CZ22_9GAMM|nr:type IVB secretion system protein IcmM/DotJ [Legionella maioricensis]MCL9683309.1 type IVB secretion system protein IcmM/DotJ [Legionella maioricensis]MCL9685995.1 type IVB secretion system protein IcmM/DotJ [Legionella maioricensis]
MSRETWALIKNKKNFNVHIYRRGLLLVIISLLLSVIIGLLMFYFYVNQPERDYYATSGITPPIKLKSMLAPNASPNALLPPDPPTDDVQRVIPQ